ncbi:Dihydropteroate synthase [Alteribacillus persepolensis]|uniref:Dihydropteroate synthase n=1 Tax=Alteribacillus persepolensis TaxID=568899 RepID=A0A1G8I1T6_9BACI|nr:dihydropteroate synthase [Alteribacillus persepolensis]SDI12807.1 Dihydropteroate synthase [Alteribacillus persepolensis]
MSNTQISWGKWTMDFSEKTYLMGILNVTPDSFSDGGRFNELSKAVERAQEMVEQGADIIDIGGESTRPGYTKVEIEQECSRVVPVIEAVASQVDVPISIDTYKAETARQALKAGASIINDIWGAKGDPEMAEVAAQYDVPIIVMHNRDNTDYQDLIADIIADVRESIDICKQAGVKDNRIILDPGVGFAKTYHQNLEVMRRLEEFTELGYPVLLGTSRKSIIAQTLNLPANERVEGTGATVSLGIEKGSDIVRVHDVLEMSRTVKMMDAMLGKGKVETVG